MNFLLTKGMISGIIPFVVASVAHLVERHLAKVEVASSSLVTRSIVWRRTYLGMSPFFLVPGTRYLHLNLKSEVGGPAKARGFCGYGSGFEPRHSLQKRRADLRQTFFFGIRKLFQCSPEVNSGCAKVFAPGKNTCTAHLRRPALRGPMEMYLFGYISIFSCLSELATSTLT